MAERQASLRTDGAASAAQGHVQGTRPNHSLATRLDRIQRESHELIVVGGGIQSASIAFEAASRGVRTLLLERADFGSATSASTLRILHGGLRYLQKLDLSRFRESVRERRWWLRAYPELVEPLPCLMPLYDRGAHRRGLLGPALALNDLLSWPRNRGVLAERHLPGSRLLSAQETISRLPFIARDGLRGAALWYDASMVSPQRLIIELLRRVAAMGGASLNYVRVTELIVAKGAVVGVRAVDELEGREIEFRAPLVIDGRGPWLADDLPGAGGAAVGHEFRPSLAFNVLLDRELPTGAALAVRPPGPGTPVYFLRPRGRLTLAGTVHLPWEHGSGVQATVPPERVRAFLRELNAALPALEVLERHVLRVLSGLLPAAATGGTEVLRRPLIHVHSDSGGPRGYVRVSGVKFTTALATARQVLDRVAVGRRRQEDPVSPPPTRRWIGPEELAGLAATDPLAARATIRDIAFSEAAFTPEDLTLRRLDWTLEPYEVAAPGGPLATLLDRGTLASLLPSRRGESERVG